MAFDRAYLYLTAADSNGQFAGKYKRLSFSYSEIPGETDKTGNAIGPVRMVSITARGYWGDFPSRLDLEGILFTLGFDMTRIDVFRPSETFHNERKTNYGARSTDTYIYKQIKIPVSTSAPASNNTHATACAAS